MAKLRTYAMEIKETLDFENFKHQVSEKWRRCRTMPSAEDAVAT